MELHKDGLTCGGARALWLATDPTSPLHLSRLGFCTLMCCLPGPPALTSEFAYWPVGKGHHPWAPNQLSWH